jgi:Phasin protein
MRVVRRTTVSEQTTMTTRTFDPNSLIAATREAFAPVLKAQQEGFKTFERLARLQYAVAGDVLESSLARVNAAFAASTPGELFSKHSDHHAARRQDARPCRGIRNRDLGDPDEVQPARQRDGRSGSPLPQGGLIS